MHSWYEPLTPQYNPLSQRIQFTPPGRWLTATMLRVMEALCLAPAGTAKVQRMLQQGGMGCADGGITCPGDAAKAFGGGADFIMMGGMFAGTEEAAGATVERNGKKYKHFL